MRGLLRLAPLLALILVMACNAAPTPTPPLGYSGFSVGYDTGSVPPPFNYTYMLDGTFSTTALSVHYVLTYQFRDQLTPDEITSNGYTTHDDIDWTAQLNGATQDTWRALLAATTLGPIPPLVPGADSFNVTLTPLTGEPQFGVPANRDAWQAAIAALDKQARTATGATRSQP